MWTSDAWQQDDAINGGYPMPIDTSPPIPFDVEQLYTEWIFDPLYNRGYPYIVFMPDWIWPSQEYYDAIAAPSRTTMITGTITAGSEIYAFDDADILSGSLSISSSMLSGDTLLPGGVPSAELRLSLSDRLQAAIAYGAEIVLTYCIKLANSNWYEVPLGVFRIYDATKQDDYYALTCYDAMKQLDAIQYAGMEIETDRAYTPFEIVQICCDSAGLTMGTPENQWANYLGFDSVFTLSNVRGGIETARDLLMHTVQTMNAFAFIDRWGILQIVSIVPKDAVQTIQTRQRKLTKTSALKYRLLMLETDITLHDTDQTQTHSVSYMTLNADGVTVTLPENPLWGVIEPRNDTETRFVTARRQVSAIADLLEMVDFYPIETEIFGDPSICLFDFISYPDRKTNQIVTSPITSYNWQYHGSHRLTTAGEEAVAGIAKAQAEKAAAAARVEMQGNVGNIMRELYLKMMQQGHHGMANFTHDELSHYTHSELGGTK